MRVGWVGLILKFFANIGSYASAAVFPGGMAFLTSTSGTECLRRRRALASQRRDSVATRRAGVRQIKALRIAARFSHGGVHRPLLNDEKGSSIKAEPLFQNLRLSM